ncbi:hypothetical protein B0T14DRAFT_562278 [Immersiella caudata]|uniref:Uncharacterized protein n=1 Tax=Immersiella caudata TaxID=314043 RepID=A0AA39X314_9PEZI|nr:hypothetical protein B0T14DRAFT_562278 [Immersiella caudata]
MASPGAEAPPLDDEFDEQAMAQFMGFSSFGAQEQNRPSKKRRFNSHVDDAVIAGVPRPAGLPAKPPAPSASGANSLPLHPRGVPSTDSTTSKKGKQTQPASENSEEIGLSSSNPAPPGKPIFPPGPSIETINAAIAARSPGGVFPPNWDPSDPKGSPWQIGGDHEPTTNHSGVASRGSPDPILPAPLPGRKWYDDYYDRASNENPWERIENARGIGPISPWPSNSATAQSSKAR